VFDVSAGFGQVERRSFGAIPIPVLYVVVKITAKVTQAIAALLWSPETKRPAAIGAKIKGMVKRLACGFAIRRLRLPRREISSFSTLFDITKQNQGK
jgi:hypothetical protein